MDELRNVQLYLLQMLKDVADVCEKNNIKYSLSGGTLLGAVRHKGFIPWDDDIDIMMEWSEYKKFLRIAPKKLGDNYFVQNYKTDHGFWFPWTKIRANETTSMPRGEYKWNIHWGICIDVFPIIGIRKTQVNKKEKKYLSNKILLMDEYLKATNHELSKKQKVIYSVPKTIRRVLYFWKEKTYLKDPNKFDYCFELWWFQCLYPTSILKDYSMIKFEDRDFMTISDFDTYLKINYGDYMKLPPKNERCGHQLSLGEIIWDTRKSYVEYIKEFNQFG